MIERLRKDAGLALLVLALLLAATLYAPTLGRGLVNYEDTWLYHDNFVLQDASLTSLRVMFFDLDVHSPARLAVAPEYLPVRDLSVMLDFAVWGDWYPGFHLVNLALYLVAIGLAFAMFTAFGIDRKVAGLACLLWAIHPSHAESVAWLSERKGLLAAVFVGLVGLGYARFRAGGRTHWLILAAFASGCAVWSKAPAAFAIAALAGIELVAPAPRISWRRSLLGLGAIAVVSGLAFVPVLIMAAEAAVVGGSSAVPGGWAEIIVGTHGFYLQLAAMTVQNAIAYPISDIGPSAGQVTLGALGLAALAAGLMPRLGRHRVPPEVRAGAVWWLAGWLPFSHLLVPLHMVAVADRYALFLTIGFALVVAAAVVRIPRALIRNAVVVALVVLAAVRTFDAQGSWASSLALWERAVTSNPADGVAWSMFAEALDSAGEPALAEAAVEQGLTHSQEPRLLMRRGLLLLGRGDRAGAMPAFRAAAEAGEPRAMANLALLELESGRIAEALGWARRGAAAAPHLAHARRTHGKVALTAKLHEEALTAFQWAYAIEPSAVNRYNLAITLVELGRIAEAMPHLEACAADAQIGDVAKRVLSDARRRLAPP
ncbi:MAG: hypothetical protein WKG01_35155 [Kofleriaceae bacterium]